MNFALRARSLGTTLERTWGTFRYNVYIISGMLFTVIGAFVLYGVLCATYDAAFIGGQTLLLTGSGLFSVSYIYMSIFLAFAVTYPDMEVLLYFIIPIKMKWMLPEIIPYKIITPYTSPIHFILIRITQKKTKGWEYSLGRDRKSVV